MLRHRSAIFRFLLSTLFVASAVLTTRADTLPERLTTTELQNLDADKTSVSGAFPGLLLVPQGTRNSVDGKYNQPYHAACYIYAAQHAAGQDAIIGYARRFIVHVPEADNLPLAQRVARLLLLIYGENSTRMHYDHPTDLATVDVWLTRSAGAGLSPDVGGEQTKNQIYIYDLAAERKPIEWAREVAHEYGHFALPGVSGFTAPEEWGNGVLGERLFLKWLAEDMRAGRIKPEEIPFVTPEQIGDYLNRQVMPLLRRIAREGVDAGAMRRKDASGMDTFTGVALYTDTVYGSKALLDAFAYTTPKEGNVFIQSPDFLRGLQGALNDATQFTLSLPLPGLNTFFVFLPRGEFHVSAEGTTRSWQFPLDSKFVHTTGKDTLLVTHSDWRKITVSPTHASDTPMRLTFRRRGTEVQ